MPTNRSTAGKRMPTLLKLIDKYYHDLRDLTNQNVMFEMGTRPALHMLLAAEGTASTTPNTSSA